MKNIKCHLVQTVFFLYLIYTTCCLLPIKLNAQNSFKKTYGGRSNDLGWSVQQTQDGGYIITGNTNSFGAGFSDVYLIKTDSLGDTLWVKTYGGIGYDGGRSVQVTSDGGYIIAGYTSSFGPRFDNVYLIKTDSFGDTQWTKVYGDTLSDLGWSIRETTGGGYIILGYTDSFGAGKNDFYLLKTNSIGETLWTQTYGDTSNDVGWDVQETKDGGYILTGYTDSFGAGLSDVYIVRIDSSGIPLWTRTYGGIWFDYGFSVQQTSDSGYIIAGSSISFSGGSYFDVYLIKTNPSGDTLWTGTYGGIYNDWGYSVQETPNGDYIVAGYSDPLDTDTVDVYLIRIDSLGSLLWEKTYGGTSTDVGFSVQHTTDGGFIIAGYTESFGEGGEDVYLIKTAGDGTVGIKEGSTELIVDYSSFKLFQNHPNPFQRRTVIGYSLPAPGSVSLKIYDINGRLVEILVNDQKEPGIYEAYWDGKNKANGIYFYRLSNSNLTATKKMILLK
jgi:hypothetical protein